MNEHTDHQHDGYSNGVHTSTAVLDQPVAHDGGHHDDDRHGTGHAAQTDAQDGHGHDAIDHATDAPTEATDATRPKRQRNRSRAARSSAATAPGDLPAVLHRHLAAMGPQEALHALDAVGRLAALVQAHSEQTSPALFAQLVDELDGCADKRAIRRLVSMLGDLLAVVADPATADAAAQLITFARLPIAAEAERAAERARNRR